MKQTGQVHVLSILVFLCIFSSMLFPQGSNYKVTGDINIGGGSRWDYIAVDTSSHRLVCYTCFGSKCY